MKFITSGTVSGFNSQFVILQYYTSITLHIMWYPCNVGSTCWTVGAYCV